METPERIEVLPLTDMPELIFLDPQNPWNGKGRVMGFLEKREDDVEYIRKDIAEQMAKEFAKIYANELVSGFTMPNIDELFTEFIKI